MKKNRLADSQISVNRRASYEYFLSDFLEVGIVLTGTEIKSIRKNNLALNDTFILFRNGEAFIENLYIAPYEFGNIFNHEPRARRKLLMHKREIKKFATLVEQDSYTCIPVKSYYVRGRVKIQIALGKGKKNYDKRETIKARDDERSMREATKKGSRYDSY